MMMENFWTNVHLVGLEDDLKSGAIVVYFFALVTLTRRWLPVDF